MLSKEQVLELKKQLLEQVKHLPSNKKAEAEAQIHAMSAEALESMLEEQRSSPKESKGVYRMIASGDIPSKILEQNSECIAVLEIKPLSKAHIIIIPKTPVSGKIKMPAKAFSLARKLAKRIQKKLRAESVEIQTETKFGEQIINVIPRYKDRQLERYDASDSELTELQKTLKTTKVIRKSKPKAVKNLLSVKKRLP